MLTDSSHPAPIRVVLVDDQELVRAGLRMVLEEQPDMVIVGEAADGEQAIEVVAATDPDVVVMDVRMPRTDGVDATRRITASGARCRVLILTTFDLDEYAFTALRYGASGFLLKDVPSAQLIAAIGHIARGTRSSHPASLGGCSTPMPTACQSCATRQSTPIRWRA